MELYLFKVKYMGDSLSVPNNVIVIPKVPNNIIGFHISIKVLFKIPAL